jgi:D-glycero-D-manno-heptose 1,7-bisphosphate phosphatase
MNPNSIFLDRDGVINVKAPEGDYIKSIDELHLLPHVGEAIRLLNESGYNVIVITNQRGIALKKMTMDDVLSIHNQINKELAGEQAHIDDFFICPHDKGVCHCRKPEIGLFLQAEKKYPVIRESSYMIGDSPSDIKAGHNYGLRSIAVHNPVPEADYYAEDLLQAVQLILKSREK